MAQMSEQESQGDSVGSESSEDDESQSSRGSIYTTTEEKKIVDYIVKNNAYHRVKGVALCKEMSQNKVVDRRYWSLYSHIKAKILPKIHETDELITSQEEKDKFPLSSFKPGTEVRTKTRTVVTKNQVLNVAKMLVAYKGIPTPTGKKFWQNAILTEDTTLSASNCLSIFRNHVNKQLDGDYFPDELKQQLIEKLQKVPKGLELRVPTIKKNTLSSFLNGLLSTTHSEIPVSARLSKSSEAGVNVAAPESTKMEEVTETENDFDNVKVTLSARQPAIKRKNLETPNTNKKRKTIKSALILTKLIQNEINAGSGLQQKIACAAETTINHLYEIARLEIDRNNNSLEILSELNPSNLMASRI